MSNGNNEFTAQKVETGMMHLALELPGLKMDQILQVFSAGRMPGCYDDEKGYDNDEVGFVHLSSNIPFYVYSRYGIPRIGCRDNGEHLVEELAAFIKASL